jgi:REP element-mobilizing transposase RayT
LRKNRVAIPGARYFVTAVTRDRKKGLACFLFWAKLLELASRDEADILAMVAMPDHLHGLFVLPDESLPGDVVRRLKGPLLPTLRSLKLGWQKNYFEHRLRPEEEAEPYLRYMMANPYRAGLVEQDEVWPYWAITSPSARWFIDKFPKQIPEPEWLALARPWESQG